MIIDTCYNLFFILHGSIWPWVGYILKRLSHFEIFCGNNVCFEFSFEVLILAYNLVLHMISLEVNRWPYNLLYFFLLISSLSFQWRCKHYFGEYFFADFRLLYVWCATKIMIIPNACILKKTYCSNYVFMLCYHVNNDTNNIILYVIVSSTFSLIYLMLQHHVCYRNVCHSCVRAVCVAIYLFLFLDT